MKEKVRDNCKIFHVLTLLVNSFPNIVSNNDYTWNIIQLFFHNETILEIYNIYLDYLVFHFLPNKEYFVYSFSPDKKY
jgi:hypothetical protein